MQKQEKVDIEMRWIRRLKINKKIIPLPININELGDNIHI